MWVVLQEELNEQDVTRDDAPAARPLTADENDRAAVWLEIEELRFLEDERLRNQSVKRVVQYLERGNIPLIDRIHLLNAFRVHILSSCNLDFARFRYIDERASAGRISGCRGARAAAGRLAVAAEASHATTVTGCIH